MDRALFEWLQSRPNQQGFEDPKLHLSYTIYGCMLILPAGAFDRSRWPKVFEQCSASDIHQLYEVIAKHLKVTHIAINSPIPPLESSSDAANVLRAPRNFSPLYGDFGPSTCTSPPTSADFDAAFWVTAKQNGVYQVWAPRWTMFSRGNISEKARLITLPSVLEAVQDGKTGGRGCSAVDLYAGIGYFTFSYLTAGVEKVLCWDLNAWSIEGLKRGAKANKWSVATGDNEFPGDTATATTTSDPRLFIFQETNKLASDRIQKLRDDIPPIRHVNCGLLPSSQASWKIAVDALDDNLGGWVHIHENFAVAEIDEKAEEVRLALERLVYDRCVELDSINRVKSYAPGVMHCVLDYHISLGTRVSR